MHHITLAMGVLSYLSVILSIITHELHLQDVQVITHARTHARGYSPDLMHSTHARTKMRTHARTHAYAVCCSHDLTQSTHARTRTHTHTRTVLAAHLQDWHACTFARVHMHAQRREPVTRSPW